MQQKSINPAMAGGVIVVVVAVIGFFAYSRITGGGGRNLTPEDQSKLEQSTRMDMSKMRPPRGPSSGGGPRAPGGMPGAPRR